MADEQKPKLENLEPNRETSQELTNDEAEAAKGGDCTSGNYANVTLGMRKAGGSADTAGKEFLL